jgi:hypothetical protein
MEGFPSGYTLYHRLTKDGEKSRIDSYLYGMLVPDFAEIFTDSFLRP